MKQTTRYAAIREICERQIADCRRVADNMRRDPHWAKMAETLDVIAESWAMLLAKVEIAQVMNR